MAVDLVLHEGKVYTRGEVVEAGIAIDDGRIVKIAKKANLPQASEKISLNGCLALPGLIDVHVHLRDQRKACKETFFSGTAAAAAGGVTLVVDMPNNDPVTMSAEALRERKRLADRQALVNVAFYSAFPEKEQEIGDIIREGAVGFKLYLLERIGGVDIEDDEAILRAFRETKKAGVPVAVHAESKETVERAEAELRSRGRNDPEAFFEAHPVQAETEAIKRILRLTTETQAKVHFCHLTSWEGLELISSAKKTGLPITCEVSPHHLFLSSEDIERYGAFAVTVPPLRNRAEVKALWRGLKEGLIDVLASDHAPHTLEEKQAEAVWDVKPGIPGLETTLRLMLTQLNRGRISLQELTRLTSEKPAEIFGLSNRGFLREQCHADIVVVDLKREEKIDASKFHSKAKFSPFDGWRVRGKPVKTFVNGTLVMEDGEIVANPGSGRVIPGEGRVKSHSDDDPRRAQAKT